jgi:hypothetical protein
MYLILENAFRRVRGRVDGTQELPPKRRSFRQIAKVGAIEARAGYPLMLKQRAIAWLIPCRR